MKKALILLAAAALLLTACKRDKDIEVTSLTVTPASLTLEKGATGQFSATLAPATANVGTEIAWTTSNANVAMVDKASGKVTAVGGGSATITATSGNGKTAAGTVEVTVTATDFSIENTKLAVNKGETVKINVITTPADATTPVSYLSKDSGIAAVDANGLVTGIDVGATVIDVTVGSKTQSVNVTVESATEFAYAGEVYKKLKLKDGSVWMADPLRFVPAGKTPSSNPADENGIWYPYKTDGKTATPLTDEASIRMYGYLYDWETAIGAKIDKDNFKSFEGVQGICPDGWHIPTRADFMALVGYSAKAEDESSAPINENAVFYNKTYNGGDIKEMNEAGFNFVLSGCVSRGRLSVPGAYAAKPVASTTNCSIEAFAGRPTLNYLIGSTGYKFNLNKDGVMTQLQFFGGMSTFTGTYKDGRMICAYANYVIGAQLRCVKNK